ncbi:armadillo-type protein [Gaertneriomyces semiglobifer]|nr:armadillo-type protein [Gaertneriomyces semiglobifer]
MDCQPLPDPEHELYQEAPELPEAYIKYDTDENLPRVYYAGKRLLPTCSSSYFLQLSKTWDQGSKSVRVKILEEFVRCNQDKTGPQLEREFSNGASLFLTRITAWLRLTYAGDKAEALKLLASVAHAGRKYKEFICESYVGVRAIADCLARSKSEVTQDHARHLLYQLGIGNPKFLMQVYKSLLSLLTAQGAGPTPQQMAGQALRMLLPSIQAIHPSIVEATIALLKSTHIQIQYEGYEILRELITRPPLQEAILSQLIIILRTSIEDIQDDAPDERRRRQRTGDGKTFGGQWGGGLVPKSEDKAFNDSITSGYIQQAYAAKLLGLIAATRRELAERMIDMQIVSGLLNVISNVGNPDSQQYAASALIYFVETFQFVAQALKEHMGQNFFDLLEDKPDTFFRELTREQVRYLRRNAVIIRGAGSQASLSDWDDNYDTDEERERFVQVLLQMRFPVLTL